MGQGISTCEVQPVPKDTDCEKVITPRAVNKSINNTDPIKKDHKEHCPVALTASPKQGNSGNKSSQKQDTPAVFDLPSPRNASKSPRNASKSPRNASKSPRNAHGSPSHKHGRMGEPKYLDAKPCDNADESGDKLVNKTPQSVGLNTLLGPTAVQRPRVPKSHEHHKRSSDSNLQFSTYGLEPIPNPLFAESSEVDEDELEGGVGMSQIMSHIAEGSEEEDEGAPDVAYGVWE